MEFRKKIRGIFGFLGFKGHNHYHDRNSKDDGDDDHDAQPRPATTGHPRQVVVDRPHLPPVLTPTASGDGGLQGLGWYGELLKMDKDGDVADEFLDEVSYEMPEAHAVDHHKITASFQPNNNIRPANVKRQILLEGKIIPQFAEDKGRLQ
ncbi:hypothetical protein Fmac_002263 [Flemingia macrophylla]|uniref:Uncharacterized protein n=1 Tax=Flemingia macrophylla TaxID=520843 RepID=A0ABD1NK77_9FABA